MKFAFVAALSLAVAFAACGGESDERSSTFEAKGTAVPSDAIEDPSCNTHSTAEKRADIPAGACVSGATCGFQTPAGPDSCTPGRRYYAAVPNEWNCTCDGTWHCDVIKGGFGVGTCPGWEQGTSCAVGNTCGSACQSNEACFTSVQCGAPDPVGDAGPSCKRADGAGDDTCHVVCAKDTDCPIGQDCIAIDFWGCSDFNGNSQNDHLKKICCPAGSNCETP